MLCTRLESGGAGHVLEQDLPVGLVFLTNEAQPQEEAAERVFFVVHRLFLGGASLLIAGHITELADEGVIGFDAVGIRIAGEPREGNLLIGNFQRQVVGAQRLANEALLGGDDALQDFKVGVGEAASGHGNADAGDFFLGRSFRFLVGFRLFDGFRRFGCFRNFRIGKILGAQFHIKALFLQMGQESLEDIPVDTVIKGEAAVSFNDEIAHLVGECRASVISGGAPQPLGNGICQSLALVTVGVDFNSHLCDLLNFW